MSESTQTLDFAASWTGRELAGEASRYVLQRFPRLYISLARRRNPHRSLINESTDLLLEGFPRSGNTYLLSWLTLANPNLRVASHLHSVSHARVALRQGVPVVILLRPPKEALASEYLNRLGRNESISLRNLLYRYRHFYSQAIRYADDVVFSPFECTTGHPEAVATAVWERSKLGLTSNLTLSNNAVLEDVERLNTLHVGDSNELTVARPSRSRADLADHTKQYLAENYPSALAHLQDLHDRLASCPTAVRWADVAPSDRESPRSGTS